MNKILGGCIGLVFIFVMGSSQRPQTEASPTAEATVDVAQTMDAAPTNCGPVAEPMQISPDYGAVIGAWPIWGTRGVLALSKDRSGASYPAGLEGWWPSKVLWLVKASYNGSVKLHGYNIADNSPIYFTMNTDNPLTTQPILNPEEPAAFAPGSDEYANFPSLVWVSKAGCYVIEAEWAGGLWRQTIPVGYVEDH